MGALAAPVSISGPRARVVPFALLSDESLARLAGDGDDAAFGALFNRYRASLSRYCRSILRDAAEAEDAFQNTMVCALRGLRRENLSGRVKPWLYRIAHNESISLIRRRRPEESLVEALPDDLAAGLDDDARDRLSQLFSDLGALPEQQRSALVMRELVGLEYSEIASVLVISSVAARKAVYEARLSLGMLDAGRESNCTEIRSCISEGDRRMLRSRRIRAHLISCSDCTSFERAIRRRQRTFAMIPALPGCPLLAALGGGAATAGGSSAVGGAGLTIKCLGICAFLAAGATGLLAAGRPSGPPAAATFRVTHASPPSVQWAAPRPAASPHRLRVAHTTPAPHVAPLVAPSPTRPAPSTPSLHQSSPQSPAPAAPAPRPAPVRPQSGGPVAGTLSSVVHTVGRTVGTVKALGSTAGAAATQLVHSVAGRVLPNANANAGSGGAVGGLVTTAKNLLK